MSTDLIAAFPAGGAGGTTVDTLRELAGRRGMAFAALTNASSTEVLGSGAWQEESAGELRRLADSTTARRVVLVGHCMGGLSAVRLAAGLGPGFGRPVGVLVVNTPCPDDLGRIPTMSGYTDAEIAETLRRDGFPEEVLEDEDMLAEVADGLRRDAEVADRLAEWVSATGQLETLHVLSTRGDRFIPPEQCAAWRHRVHGDFHLTITAGGHALDAESAPALERALDGLLSTVPAEPA
ncbi:MAG TPA: alpha/beta fold hydrolase [Pseudonocardiaceae bacterium]